ncbi:hypothetical protein MED01_003335 [Micromonospora sp. MED01]|uniref:hypothetical protein n=1 Tax=Micromonospora alfalfae TaxID=2911212 RepID=UPI001EE912D0|nr:hypothetical protein [Micromonospora alfalfae]MCG5465065.1 hypothetical protein [Micromonospora alfalfae]
MNGAPLKKYDEIPTYAAGDTDQVGARLTEQIDYLMPVIMSSTGVDDAVWETAPDGQALVLALAPGEVRVWAAREFLRDGAYRVTELEIELLAEQSRQQLLKTFWAGKRKHYAELAEIVLKTEINGTTVTAAPDVVTVPAGRYTKQIVVDGETWQDQLAPFSILLPIDDVLVSVSPDDVEGVDDSHVVAAQEEGRATRLPAATVRARFATTATIVRPYVPASDWLTDTQLHYPTPTQMGAVFVLRRMPADEGEIEQTRQNDPELFQQGLTSPGVRLDDHIYVRIDHLGTGTEYHEAMHKLSHRTFRAVMGWDFNEGATEYFTRLLLAESEDVVRNDAQYASQRSGVEFLIDRGLITSQDLATAYFRGLLEPLFRKVREATRGTKLVSLQAYAHALGPRSYDAQSFLGQVLDRGV